jgi:hypothetical protein
MRTVWLLIFFFVAKPALFSQSYYKGTTENLLKLLAVKDREFDDSNIRWAISLIDSSTASELALNSPGISCDGKNNPENIIAAIMARRFRNDVLKTKMLRDMQAFRCRCNDSTYREPINKNESAGYYSIDPATYAGFSFQFPDKDTSIIQTAVAEFEFWAPLALSYLNTSSNVFKQIGSGKQKLDPCMSAGLQNASVWANYIYNRTGQTDLPFASLKAKTLYDKLLRGKNQVNVPPRFRDPFTKLNVGGVYLNGQYGNLEQLDFEKETTLKSLLDEVRGKQDWNIIIYTNGTRGILYRSCIFQYAKFEQAFLLELEAPSQLTLTRIKLIDFYL